ncbi:MAG: NADH-quinone oxidoreductase subunit NuoI [Terriglobia bacterium]|jgi:NADH-quinone oxidoreductase subunit I
MANILQEIADSTVAIAKGFGITLRTMLFRPTVTENYPDEPVHFEDRYRGVHVLRRDENGFEKCVACFLCAAACPSNCIYIEAAENTTEKRISAAERYAKVYNIDYNRCIFCGYCVEACPCDAITHGQGFEIAAYNTNELVWRKEQLLEKCSAPVASKKEAVTE